MLSVYWNIKSFKQNTQIGVLAIEYKLKIFIPMGLEAGVRFGFVGRSTWMACLGCTQLPQVLCHPPEESSPSQHWKMCVNFKMISIITLRWSEKWLIYQIVEKKRTLKSKTWSQKTICTTNETGNARARTLAERKHLHLQSRMCRVAYWRHQ